MESDDIVYDYQARIKSLPKVKYSSLTEREKLWMAYNCKLSSSEISYSFFDRSVFYFEQII